MQLRFQIEDANAKINKTPRPTYPLPLAVLAGSSPPDVDICNLPFSAVTQVIFNECLQEGMNYFQVANTFGFEGKERQRTGEEVTYSWGASEGGLAIVVFKNDKLSSKSQNSLK